MDSIKLLPHLFEAAYVVDENRKILFWNEQAERITGYKSEDIVGKFCYDNTLRHVTKSGHRLCHDGCPLFASLTTKKINQANVFLHHKDGYRVPVTVKTIPYYDEETKTFKAIEVFSDLKEESILFNENKQLQIKIVTDQLTKVFNRGFIDYQIETCIKEFNTFNTQFGIVFIDIDHFKGVNDTYGHDIGDKVLIAVSKTIFMNIRASDFIGRYGGEEFVVLLRHIDKDDLFKTAEKIRLLVQGTDLTVGDKKINVTVSAGCSHYEPPLTREELVKSADKKMYEAKQSGRNRVII